jgi:hypothetical protein
MTTLADLQAREIAVTPTVEVEVSEIPAIVPFDVELTKLGTDKAKTRYFGELDGQAVSTLAYLPGQLPEVLKGQTLELAIGDATSKTAKGRTKLTWEQETAEGMVLVLGYVPEDAAHVEGFALSFPKGK